MLHFTSQIGKCKLKPQFELTLHNERTGTIKKLTTPNVNQVVEELEPSCTAGGGMKWYSHLRRQFGSFL